MGVEISSGEQEWAEGKGGYKANSELYPGTQA